MSFSKNILSVLVAAGFAFAANTVTYTAQSKVSQKDADKKALEGVALQIGAQVKSSFETHTVERVDGSIESTADSKKSVSTNILLKGAKLQAGPKKNGLFQTTVTVDLDQLASKILLDLEKIKVQMKSKDSLIRLDMLDRDYRKMESEMILLEKLAVSYNEQLEGLSYVQAVPKELRLETTLGELTEFLISSMQTVKFETKLTSEALSVTVSDFAGPIANFPVVITQDNKDLAAEKTNADGVAVFSLKDVMKNKPSGLVTVHADMNFKFVRQSALHSKTVSYAAQKSGCKFKLACAGSATDCGALQKFLGEAGFSIADKKGLPELSAKLEFSDKANSANTLTTSRATVTLRHGDTELVEQSQGVGRDSDQAHAKAIAKLPATRIAETFGKKCSAK